MCAHLMSAADLKVVEVTSADIIADGYPLNETLPGGRTPVWTVPEA
jgi:hypothetical protein